MELLTAVFKQEWDTDFLHTQRRAEGVDLRVLFYLHHSVGHSARLRTQAELWLASSVTDLCLMEP